MTTVVQAAKALLPGSILLLLAVATLGAAMLYVRRPMGRAGRMLRLVATLVVAWYWISSLPVVADALQRSAMVPPVAVETLPNAAIVVLGAGVETYFASDGEIDVPRAQSAFNV